VAFRLLYRPSALTDLEAVFSWSMEKHPAETEKFANDLFNRLDLLAAFPYLGALVKGRPNIRRLLHSRLHISTRSIN
jgi:plasmid stabilization system protein ParE